MMKWIKGEEKCGQESEQKHRIYSVEDHYLLIDTDSQMIKLKNLSNLMTKLKLHLLQSLKNKSTVKFDSFKMIGQRGIDINLFNSFHRKLSTRVELDQIFNEKKQEHESKRPLDYNFMIDNLIKD